MFARIGSQNFRNEFKTVPSTSSLRRAVMGRVGSTRRTITCGDPALPGRGHRGFPGAAPTLRHPTAPGPPVCSFPNPNLGVKEDKDDPNTNGSGRGFHPALSTTQCCLSPAKQRLLQNFPPPAASAPHQLSWVEQVQIKFRLVREGQLFTDCLLLQFLTQMKHAGSYA